MKAKEQTIYVFVNLAFSGMSILYREKKFQDLLARRALICEDCKNSDNNSELMP